MIRSVSFGFNLCYHSHTHNNCVGHYSTHFYLILWLRFYISTLIFLFSWHFYFRLSCSFWKRQYINSTKLKDNVKTDQLVISVENKLGRKVALYIPLGISYKIVGKALQEPQGLKPITVSLDDKESIALIKCWDCLTIRPDTDSFSRLTFLISLLVLWVWTITGFRAESEVLVQYFG